MTLTAPARPADGGLAFDLAERGFLLALGLGAIVRLAPAAATQPNVALILMSEALAVVFILLRRRAVRADVSPYAALVAFLGTAAPLLVVPGGRSLIAPTVGVWWMAGGLLLSIAAKLALNRSFGLAAANRGVKRAGPYRLLRHPMYAGYVATQAAFLLLHPCAWNLAVYALSWTVQLLRIRAEERVLMEDAAYRAYAGEVPFRLLPGVY